MAKIHDKFVIELAEVIKGYGNDPDVDDPFCLSMFYRFYELPNIAVSRENFEKMRPVEPERKTGRWQEDPSGYGFWICSACGFVSEASGADLLYKFCPHCGLPMIGGDDNE